MHLFLFLSFYVPGLCMAFCLRRRWNRFLSISNQKNMLRPKAMTEARLGESLPRELKYARDLKRGDSFYFTGQSYQFIVVEHRKTLWLIGRVVADGIIDEPFSTDFDGVTFVEKIDFL